MPASKAKRAQVAERRSRAVAMRMSGLSFQQIADTLGYKTRAAACQDVSRALEASRHEMAIQAELLVTQEVESLEALERVAWAVLRRPHALVSQGRVMKDDDGNVLADDAITLQSVQAIRQLRESRRKLLGLDQPAKTRVEVANDVDQQIELLVRQLAATPAGGQAPVAGEVVSRADGPPARVLPAVAEASPPEAAPSG
jgi:hypothetical protein